MDNSVIKFKKKNNSSVIIDVNQKNHGLSVGDVVYYSKPSDSYYGRYEKANATVLEKANAIGFVYKIIDTNKFELIVSGIIDNVLFKNYAVGEQIYLGPTDGSTTNINQVYSKPLGVKTKNGILINIQRGTINITQSEEDTNGFSTGSGSSSSEFIIKQTAHGLSIGDVVYCSDTGYAKALANETQMVEAVGIVSGIVSADEFRLMTNGFFKTSLFDAYPNSTVFFLSMQTPGALTIEEDYISKPIATKVTDGLIIDIQRGTIYNLTEPEETSGDGLVYKTEDKIGDVKYSTDTISIRTDGYILFKNDQEYNKDQIRPLLNSVSQSFLDTYIIDLTTTVKFKNIELFTDTVHYPSENPASNLYIKAFNANNGTLIEVPVGNIIITLDVSPPTYYIRLDGRECTIIEYPALASYIFNTYGSYTYFGGDGISTFGLPNLDAVINDINGMQISMYYYIKYC